MVPRNSFTVPLTKPQQDALIARLKSGNYVPRTVPYTVIAVEAPDCNIALYTSGKCVVQGKGAQDWVTFTLEPMVLQEARLGYEEILSPEASAPHMGIDESGKGDFFGPMVIAAAYVDASIVKSFRSLNVRDSKTITSDRKAEEMADSIARILGDRFAIVTIGPRAYNRLYASMRNVNQILAWGHSRAIENLLEKVPDCPRAISDQFGPVRQIEQALMQKGRKIELIQRPKAESDPAVAAASVLARATFIRALRQMQKTHGVVIPKGASDRVRESAKVLVEKKGPAILLDTVKCHFKTTEMVLDHFHLKRNALGPDGEAVSRVKGPWVKRPKKKPSTP